MALLRGTIKAVIALAALLAAGPMSASAAAFSAKRGINMDIWVTWPDEARWSDPTVLLPFPEWRKSVDGEKLAALKAQGFDFVRMPVDPSVLLSENTGALREEIYESVLESVRLVNGAGLKVIVDMHLIPAGANRSIGMAQVMADDGLFGAYVEAVRGMAATLAGEDPAEVALEIMNEPIVDCEDGQKRWPGQLKRLFSAARASATRLSLVLPGGCWASASGLAALDPNQIPDDNIVWTFHSYAPFLLTHQGATWAGDFIPYVTGLPYPPHSVPRQELDAAVERIRDRIRAEAPWSRRSGMLAYLDEQIATVDTEAELAGVIEDPFRIVATWADGNGIDRKDILLGEFGMIRQEYGTSYVMPGPWRAAYVRDVASRAERYGFGWSVWGYGGAFGIVEEFEGRAAEPDVLDAIRSLDRR